MTEIRPRADGSADFEIVPGKTDLEMAQMYRAQAQNALQELLGIMNEARRHDLVIGFQIGPPDGFNRQSVVLLEISKKLC